MFEPARTHRDHLLQILLHLRIHPALQKIERNSISIGRPQVVLRRECVQNGPQNELHNMKSEEMTESEDFFDVGEECANLCRQDSNASFNIISDFPMKYEHKRKNCWSVPKCKENEGTLVGKMEK